MPAVYHGAGCSPIAIAPRSHVALTPYLPRAIVPRAAHR
jgi:hypothetical protein